MTQDLPEDARRPRWGRRLAAAGALLALVSPWWGPPLFRRMDFFRVREVEVRNARFTPPDEVRQRLGIDTTFSIWDDMGPLEERVATHPQVSGVRITRRFPSTLVVRLEEHLPIALVPSRDGLRAYDAAGRALPLNPSRTPVDLPIVQRPDSAIFRLLGELQAGAPGLYARLNEVHRVARDELALDLVAFTVRVRPDVGADRLVQISSVEAELVARQVRVQELDFRYRDQVIARFQ
ncbi:MAG TPA: FtsQ-type POTRA domain-containing protein [Gemmatimonadaceae bacterium]